jgi:hypothetical protein
MPSWKKVLVSGSSAQLNEVTASGGFSGDGSGLSGVTADTANIAVLEEGSSLTSQVSSLDFVGSSVTAAASGNAITVTVSGTSGNALDDAWDRDDNDDIMPSTSNQVVDVHWALDSNNDIMPRVAQ